MPNAQNPIASEGAVVKRFSNLRRKAGLSQAELGRVIGLTRMQVANIEICRTVLGFWAGWNMCRVLDINQRHLAIGLLPEKPFINLNPLDLGIPIADCESFLDAYLHIVGSEINVRTSKLEYELTDSATPASVLSVNTQLPSLLNRLNKATALTGKMSELATFLNVPLASVSRWLSGKREPGGEATLQMLKWVEQQERKK